MRAMRHWLLRPRALFAVGLLLAGLGVDFAYHKLKVSSKIWDSPFARTVLVQPASSLGAQHVRFYVTGSNGAPESGKAIEYFHNSGSQVVATDTNGIADLVPGEWDVQRIVLDGHTILESRWTYLIFRPDPSHGLEVRIQTK